jgi:hypothetical protein
MVVVASAFTVAAAAAAEIVAVPPGIPVPARLTERISSQDAQTGQVFHFETAARVRVGAIDVPERTPGQGVVTQAESARGAKPGKLSLRVVSIDLADGRAIPVGPAPDASPPPAAKRHLIVVPVPIGGLLLFGVGGQSTNVVLERGTALQIVTASPPTPAPAPRAS